MLGGCLLALRRLLARATTLLAACPPGQRSATATGTTSCSELVGGAYEYEFSIESCAGEVEEGLGGKVG